MLFGKHVRVFPKRRTCFFRQSVRFFTDKAGTFCEASVLKLYTFYKYETTMKNSICMILLLLGSLLASCCPAEKGEVVVYPAPQGEQLHAGYRVTAAGREVPVYRAKVGMERRANRERAMDDQPNSHLFYDIAGFASFDIKRGPVSVAVTADEPIRTAKVLPVSAGIIPSFEGHTLRFEIDTPRHLTVEVNGEHIRSLHLFANPEETDRPDPSDPNVIYFGPGIHHISKSIEVEDNQTVYVAGGAIVRCFNDTVAESSGKEAQRRSRQASFILKGKHATLRGRGIIDQENVYRMKARQMVSVTGEDIRMEGIVLRNSSVWTVSLRGADRVVIDNIKLLGHRANSDGIDICDSWDVRVENCFIRTLDDLIVVKTYNRPEGSGRVLARRCVLWNEVAHALSIGAEIQQQVDGVTFTDCDIIGDHCREWSLRVYQCDKGVVKNIRFENIRIEEAVKFASLWVNEATWSTDPERGHIQGVVFKDISVTTPAPLQKDMEFLGFDEGHAVRDVLVENVCINGKQVTRGDIVMNPYVYEVTVRPGETVELPEEQPVTAGSAPGEMERIGAVCASEGLPEIRKERVIVYPAPRNEALQTDYGVEVEGETVPVYRMQASTSELSPTVGQCGFAYFDLRKGPVTVTLSSRHSVAKAVVTRFVQGEERKEIVPVTSVTTEGSSLSRVQLHIDRPQNLVVSFDNDPMRCLHLFVNEEETDRPDFNDPDVVYFGPGSYRLPAMRLEDGMTVYVSGGAVVHAYVGPHEWYTIDPQTGQKNYDPFYMYDLDGRNITFRGRGVIDQTDVPTYGRRSVRVRGENIRMEGLIFRDPSDWAIGIEQASNVCIRNIKFLAPRSSAAGVGFLPGQKRQNVRIEGCFIRTAGRPWIGMPPLSKGIQPRGTAPTVVSDANFVY